MRRVLTVLLALCMVVSLLPVHALAANSAGSGLDALGVRQISEKQYAVTPDVTEYEWILNNSSLTQQMMGHVMEVKVGNGSTASIAVGYGDDNIEAIKTGKNWAMKETTAQANSMQSRRGTNVVGAINAGGYDMSNGRPSGAFIMSGTVINQPTGTTFWIDKSGAAHITSAQECKDALDAGNVLEAVASFGDIFENGHARAGLDNTTRASRTAIGIKADGTVVMLMVDGRQAPYSVGMTMAEVGAAMEALGCVQAINLDGGGSSTFATQREGDPENSTTAGLTLRCRPSDGYERKVSNTIMVLSTAKPTGEFDHAVLTPNNEVYTPGSTVQFSATGVDAVGGSAAIPAGASWSVISGGGNIDNNGLYKAQNTVGEVTVGLMVGGKSVGTTSIKLQWPDKLGFTNNSVSIDFGKTSDLTFKPTWQGREVKYKDGDFTWTLDESKPISYKYNALVEEKGYGNSTKWGAGSKPEGFVWIGSEFEHKIDPWGAAPKIYMSLTGNIGESQVIEWGANETRTYKTYFSEQSVVCATNEDGQITFSVTLSHDKAEIMTADGWAECTAEDNAKLVHLEHQFPVGKFLGNSYVADENNSLRATAKVSLASNADVTGEVELVVGLEPLVLMDFEDGHGVNWNTYITNRENGYLRTGELTNEHIQQHGLWVRTATNAGVDFTGSGVVSAAQDGRVRFGEKAFKLCFDFSSCGATAAAAADAGFSCDLYVNNVQPTKIGMWVNVPVDLKDCPYLLKAVMAGGVTETQDAKTDGGYNTLNPDGSFTYSSFGENGQKGKIPKGTTMYTQYYGKGKDANGNEVELTTLGEMAGKGWIWVEADISSMQMPIDVYRAYTYRVVKTPTMPTGFKGNILIDNVQFIYGTNTNDITRPVMEAITETSSNTVLKANGSTVLPSGNLSFSAVYSDSELTDKYATGIDTTGIRVWLDGVLQTGEDKLEITEGILYLKGMNLRNGTHTLTIRLKDFYGNVTTESRTFRVEDAKGMRSAIDVLPQPEPPEIGKEYALSIVNNTGEDITSAMVTVDFSAMGDAEKYLTGAKVEESDNYTLTLDEEALNQKQAIITIEKKPPQQSLLARLFGVRSAAEYDYVSELGNLIINIPANAKEGNKLKYTVTQGTYTIDNTTTYTFSGTEQEIAFTAGYQISCEQAIAGMPADLVVTDANGNAVSRAVIYQVNGTGEPPTQLGKTSMKGKLTHTFDTPGEYTFYAEKSGSNRSWNHRVIVCEKTQENAGLPFGILTNGVTTPGTKSITWLTQIDGTNAEAQVKYSTTADMSSAETVHGTSQLQTFVQSSSGDALRCNKVQISGLTPNTTYYYQVGDGENWSDVASFTTANGNNKETNFFILGDIQSSDTSNLSRVLDDLKNNDTAYDFVVQTGDAIDNVTNYVGNWRPFLTTVNGNTLNGVDMIHVMGNHEYYGDADGEISKVIYDLPVCAQNSWYKMEYGKVCVVAINDGVKLTETLADIAENLTTDCVWKILVAHKPIYGTNPDSNSATDEIISAIESAGFDFVFGGDDHAYARTYPMIRGVKQAEDSRGGVVYYVCGDLSSKSNAFEKRDCYAAAIPHIDYSGMYLTVNATEETFTVKAIRYDGEVLDTYTETRTDCELGKHEVNDSSMYDMANGTITCAICEKGLKPEGEYAYSGLLNTTDGKTVILAGGNVKKNVFSSVGDDRYHSCADGYANKTTQSDSRTCVTGGYITYTCPECKATDKSDFQRPVDHKWNDEYVCTVCGTKGIDINSSEVIFKLGSLEKPRNLTPPPNYYYADGGVRPGSFAKRGDYVLTQNNDANLINNRIPDLYVQWPDSKNVGKAEIKCEGRGDYYGVKTLTYYIVPNDVKDLKCKSATDNSLTLTWTAAPGAEYYEIFQCDKNNSKRTSLGTTEKTTFTVTGLQQDAGYYFVAAGRTMVPTEGNKVYNSPMWSNTLHARTSPAPANVTGVSATVNGQNIAITEVDGAKYLFLPASADLKALSLTFITEPASNKVALTGDKGTVYLSDTVDITAAANVNAAGYREITATVGSGKAMTFRVMQASGLSTLYLTSKDAENKGIAFVDASKNNVVTDAKMVLVAADGTQIYNGGLNQLKARGNSTFTYAKKKSYQIKLQTPADLLGNQEQVKTWVLLANYFDATQMHDKLIKDLAAKLGLAYTASCDWVNLYYDGVYRGIYLISEKNAVGTTSVAITDMEAAYKQLNRNYGVGMTTDLAKNSYGQQYQYTTELKEPANITGGYLIELNHNMWDEVSGFKTRQGVAFNVKSPEWCGNAAMKYISEYYQEFEDAVYATDETGAYTGYNTATGKYFYDYVDMDSLVKVFLLQELSLNCDGFISSVYFYKDADGMMYAGPVWDQDMTFGTGWDQENDPSIVDYHYLANALIRIPTFKDAVNEYYNSMFAPQAHEWLGNDGTIARQYALLKNNAAMNYMLWNYIRIGNPEAAGHIWQGANYQTVVEDMTAWIEARLANMDERFQQKSTLRGDVNGDGVVNLSDAITLLRYLAKYEDGNVVLENCDINGDGNVNTSDAVALLRRLAGYED